MDEPIPSRRRWFQFGLRAMFVFVTIFSVSLGWLGLQWALVHERRAFLERLPTDMIFTVDEVRAEIQTPTQWPRVVISVDTVPTFGGERSPRPPATPSPELKLPSVPFWRRWMGDKAISAIALSDPDQTEALRLFPEASVFSFGK